VAGAHIVRSAELCQHHKEKDNGSASQPISYNLLRIREESLGPNQGHQRPVKLMIVFEKKFSEPVVVR